MQENLSQTSQMHETTDVGSISSENGQLMAASQQEVQIQNPMDRAREIQDTMARYSQELGKSALGNM